MKAHQQQVMKLAVEAAEKSGTPYGAAIIDAEGNLLAVCGNTVQIVNDATAHAEMNAIREAQKKTGSRKLANCTIFTTVEPCPMCMGAVAWSGITKIFYGASISDVTDTGGNQIMITAEEIASKSFSEISVESGVLRDECVGLLKRFYG